MVNRRSFVNGYGQIFGTEVATSGIIKSVQEGVITFSNNTDLSDTATITSVNVNSSVCYLNGITISDGDSDINDHALCSIILTNSTTVTVNRGVAPTPATVSPQVYFTVVEYEPSVINSVQTGTITMATNTENETISSVNLEKSVVINGGYTTQRADAIGRSLISLDLLNSTTVQARAGATSSNREVVYTVIEYK